MELVYQQTLFDTFGLSVGAYDRASGLKGVIIYSAGFSSDRTLQAYFIPMTDPCKNLDHSNDTRIHNVVALQLCQKQYNCSALVVQSIDNWFQMMVKSVVPLNNVSILKLSLIEDPELTNKLGNWCVMLILMTYGLKLIMQSSN